MNTQEQGPSSAGHEALIAMSFTPFANFSSLGLDRLRRMYSALPPSRDALAALFAVHAAQTSPTEQWTTFFVETASAQLIWDERPTGRLSEDDAAWLLARFDEAPSLEVLYLMVRIIDEAHEVPKGFEFEVRQRAMPFRPLFVEAAASRPETSHLRLVV